MAPSSSISTLPQHERKPHHLSNFILIAPTDSEKTPYYVPYNYHDLWMVVARNSSGQLFFDTTPNARRVFIWKPYDGSDFPKLFFKKAPKIIHDALSTTTSGTFTSTLPTDIPEGSQTTIKKTEKEVSTRHRIGIASDDTPPSTALEFPPQGKRTSTTAVPKALGMNMLHHLLKLAELMVTLSKQRSTPNLTVPNFPNVTFESPQTGNDSIVSARDEISLTKESSRLHHIHRAKLHVKRQISLDVATELGLSDAQLNSLQAQVNRRFLVGYDCSEPREVKPISSFVQDPCEPAEANSKDEYELDDPTQYQIVQYETRREFQGTRCEKHVSQFTYYCGTADHSSPYPQEIFFRRPKTIHWNECKSLASLGNYIA